MKLNFREQKHLMDKRRKMSQERRRKSRDCSFPEDKGRENFERKRPIVKYPKEIK